jgi:adenylate cyclase
MFVDGSAHASSFTTRQPGGFRDDELAALRAIVSPLARIIEVNILRRTATMLLNTYVGMRAGERILAGQIRRGHTETMHAAIWLSDLRGFTKLSDRFSSEIVVEILDLYFDCQVSAITKYGGEVLKFMGDGMLAVFPIAIDDSDAAEVCGRVLQAARECRASVAAMTHEAHADGFRFGLALHVGPVLYGNIGGRSRLDFTCIGPAINLAARMEKLTGKLNRTIVGSSVFSSHAGSDWVDLGEFSVAGFSVPERVYGLGDETGEAADQSDNS